MAESAEQLIRCPECQAMLRPNRLERHMARIDNRDLGFGFFLFSFWA